MTVRNVNASLIHQLLDSPLCTSISRPSNSAYGRQDTPRSPPHSRLTFAPPALRIRFSSAMDSVDIRTLPAGKGFVMDTLQWVLTDYGAHQPRQDGARS